MADFATANGTIYYELTEATEQREPLGTLTLLHNIMSTGQTAWGRMLPALTKHYRVLLPDLPGHGRSQGYPPHFDYAVMAEQLAALMDQVDARNGHLLGCSAGGMLAQLLVHHDLASPQTLTLISTTYSTAPAATTGAQALQPENFRFGSRWMEATAKLHDQHHHTGYYMDELLANYREQTPETTINLPLEVLQSWRLPTCIIHGEEDEFFPASTAKAMATALPNATLHIVPEQSHALIFRQSWQVLSLIEAFLAAHESKTS